VRARIAIAVVSVLLLVSDRNPAQGQDVESARSFVQKVYQDYANPDQRHQEQRQSQFYTPQLYRLILADQKGHPGEVGNLDFDPICGCQDAGNPGELKVQSITISASGSARLKVNVAFLIVKEPVKVTLALLKTPAGWRIDDITTKDMKSLRAFLKKK
jgi:hypothetical protein